MTEHASPTSIMDEKPLSPAARAGLVVNAAVTILLFYLTAILFMAGFSALALLLLLVTMAAARVGMASFVGRLLQGPVRLIKIFGRELWLPSEKTYRIAPTPRGARWGGAPCGCATPCPVVPHGAGRPTPGRTGSRQIAAPSSCAAPPPSGRRWRDSRSWTRSSPGSRGVNDWPVSNRAKRSRRGLCIGVTGAGFVFVVRRAVPRFMRKPFSQLHVGLFSRISAQYNPQVYLYQ